MRPRATWLSSPVSVYVGQTLWQKPQRLQRDISE
jgi:hypothetical protein